MTVSIEDEFLPVQDSIDFANTAIAELDQLIKAFFKRDVAEIIIDIDPKTGENVQKIKFKAHIPKDFRRKATEALNSARHSFDQAAFAARNILGKRSRKGVNYPWSRNPSDLDRLLRERGFDSRLWDTIREHEPYATSDSHVGGDDLIRTIATIANNKHTVGLSINGFIAETTFPNIKTIRIESFSIPNPIWDPAKNEAELIRWKGDIEIDGDYNFTFVVCLKDHRLAKPVDVMFALRYFTQKAKIVCDSIKAKCLEISS
ncbi:hypothetical protein [Novosphingobium sp.]|uniref:hypothetical protein n=1 Tax=Novosphingobium sp. TaxID=1874826 RepID=UPI0035AECB27